MWSAQYVFFFHSSLSDVIYEFTFFTFMSPFTQSIHLFLGLPLLPYPSTFILKTHVMYVFHFSALHAHITTNGYFLFFCNWRYFHHHQTIYCPTAGHGSPLRMTGFLGCSPTTLAYCGLVDFTRPVSGM